MSQRRQMIRSKLFWFIIGIILMLIIATILMVFCRKSENLLIEDSRTRSLKINYGTNSSELCDIGSKYDTDKSSQRKNTKGHVYPYTLFYDGLFVHQRNEPLKIAEFGILDGASLLMWREYFPAAQIYGFEYNHDLISHFRQSFDNDRITLAHIDVTSVESITGALKEICVLYDIIIEDTTHQMDDQIRVIRHAHKYLKPGGVFIIEDIFRRYNEQDYVQRLGGVLKSHFQDYYFIDCDHANARSPGWDNDKLLVLTKKGADPIFRTKNKITIITPSYRTGNLRKIRDTIRFDYVDEWIIVYDGKKIRTNPHLFDGHDKIREYVFTGEGISGNPQRNHALDLVSNQDTSLYFLDDDNVIHPNLYSLLVILDNRRLYTFNQENRLKGGKFDVGRIDTAMAIIPYSLCRDVRWIPDKYKADGYYLQECHKKDRNAHVYINNDMCYYNKLKL